jgi:chromate transporter
VRQLLNLFFVFAKIGVVTFGGGYAMLPIMRRELIASRQWISDEEFLDCVAIGQCTPGVIAVNMATFVGYTRAGVIGGIAATLGVVFPSVVIITVIAAFLSGFENNVYVKSAFAGIRVCVCVLIVNTVIGMWKSAVPSRAAYIIFALVLIPAVFMNVPLALLVVFAGVCGIAVARIKELGIK